MRLIVARCEVLYSGRLTADLPEALRLLMVKADGSVLVHADAGGYKPLNWMTPPTVIEEERCASSCASAQGRPRTGSTSARSRCFRDLGTTWATPAALEKDGVERHLQEALAAAPERCGEGFRLVRREWPTDIGPVDLMCRDLDDGWVAVEIKRIGTIEAVEQLTRYLDRIRLDPAMGALPRACWPPRSSSRRRACSPRPRASRWVEVDLASPARRARARPHAVRRLAALCASISDAALQVATARQRSRRVRACATAASWTEGTSSCAARVAEMTLAPDRACSTRSTGLHRRVRRAVPWCRRSGSARSRAGARSRSRRPALDAVDGASDDALRLAHERVEPVRT